MMHSEFSTILYRRYPFPAKEWTAINGNEWAYLGYGDNHDLMSREDLFERREDLLRKGFLNLYAQASMEEDFNMYVYGLFAYPSETLCRRGSARQDLAENPACRPGLQFDRPRLPLRRGARARITSKPGSPVKTDHPAARVIEDRAALPELPDDVFAHSRHELFFLIVTGRSSVTMKGVTTVRVMGPGTFGSTEAGPVTITVAPVSDGE